MQVCTNKDRNILVKTNEEIRVKALYPRFLASQRNDPLAKSSTSETLSLEMNAKPLLAFPNPHGMNYPKQLEWSVLCSF